MNFGPSFSVYTPAPLPADEAAREAEVRMSGLFRADVAMRLHDLVMQVRHGLRARLAALSVITGNRQRLLARAGIDAEWTGRAESFCGHALLRPHDVMVVPDTASDERFAGNPFVIGEPHIRFYAGAPLTTPSGHALGTLCVFDFRPRSGISEDERALLSRLANRAMEFSRVGNQRA